jgi:hypothetical protein
MDAMNFPVVEYRKIKGVGTFTRVEAMTLYLRRMSYPAKLMRLAREGALLSGFGVDLCYNHTHRLLRRSDQNGSRS